MKYSWWWDQTWCHYKHIDWEHSRVNNDNFGNEKPWNL